MNANRCKHLTGFVCALMLAFAGQAAAQESISDYTLYGISATTSQLIRYSFATGTGSIVGTIQSSATGQTLTGIEASAYIPGHTNIIGFWTDPADSLTKLVYINTQTAEGTVVGQPLGNSRIGGAVAVQPAGGGNHVVYAVQRMTGLGEAGNFAVLGLDGVTMNIGGSGATVNGNLGMGPNSVQNFSTGTVNGTFAVDPTADNTNSNGVVITGGTIEQDMSLAVTDALTASGVAASLTPTQTFGVIDSTLTIFGNGGLNVISVTEIKLSGKSVLTLSGGPNDKFILNIALGLKLSGGSELALSADVDPGNVFYNVLGTDGLTLLGTSDGAFGLFLVPNGPVKVTGNSTVTGAIIGGGGQIEVSGGGQINFASMNDDWDSVVDFGGRLIKVDHRIGTIEMVMPLSRGYDGLAATSDNTFYATAGQDLYVIDPQAQTETLIGAINPEIVGLEFAGSDLHGFTDVDDTLFQIDLATWQLVELGVDDPGADDLHTIVFMRNADAPVVTGFD